MKFNAFTREPITCPFDYSMVFLNKLCVRKHYSVGKGEGKIVCASTFLLSPPSFPALKELIHSQIARKSSLRGSSLRWVRVGDRRV